MGRPPTFPAEVKGWQVTGETRTFGRSTVFTYMDGAGELYLAYDFQRVVVQDYAQANGPRIIAEIYEMSTSGDAYGVFTHDPDGGDVDIGQGNAYAAGLLSFWKGHYFFRILAERETAAAKAAVIALGRLLAEPVADGTRPELLHRLPSDDLEALSIRYFHTQVSLNSFYYLADANILHLSPHTEAAMAVYRPEGEKMTLIIVRYPDARQAKRAYREFDRVYLENEVPTDWPIRVEVIEERRHVGALVHGRFLALVLDARSRAACDRLVVEVGNRL
jgi:hypothetical protein